MDIIIYVDDSQFGCIQIHVQLDGCIALNKHNTVFASKRSAICNRCFPGPTRVLDANGISIASAVFCRAH